MKKSALDQLTRSVKGGVLAPKMAGYDEARTIYNVGVMSSPAAIVRCANDADVQTAVKFAREHELPLTARAGGNSVAGHCGVEGGVVIDLRGRRKVSVDAQGVASVGGGCTWGDVLVQAGPRGATPGGFDSRVGVGGLTLAGGYGMLTRLHGLASDTLVGADVITADGERVVTSATQTPDLFWALRGAGANFGVVTSFRFQLHTPPPLTVGYFAYPIERTKELLLSYRDFVQGLPDRTTVYAGLEISPQGEYLQFLGFHFGEPAEGEAALSPLGHLGQPAHANMRVASYSNAHLANQRTFPVNHHHSWRAHFVTKLHDDVIEAVADYAARSKGLPLWMVFEHLGGAMGKPPSDSTAFAHREAAFGVVTALKWPDGEKRPTRSLRLQAELHQALRPRSIGTYLNYLPKKHTAAEAAAAYGANLPRLRTLKRRFDPDNLFRHNVNIKPAKRS